jgi:hypothetical protein
MLHPVRSMLFGDLPPVSQSSRAFFYVVWKVQECSGTGATSQAPPNQPGWKHQNRQPE